MSDIKECSICSEPAEFFGWCNENLFLCRNHKNSHIFSHNNIYIFESFYDFIGKKYQQELEYIITRLEKGLYSKIKSILERSKEEILPLLEEIREKQKYFENVIKNVKLVEKTKISEIKQIIEKKELESENKSQREKLIIERKEEIFSKVYKRIYLKTEKEEEEQEKKEENYIEKTIKAHYSRIFCLLILEDKNLLLSGSFCEIGVWNLSSLERLETLTGHSSYVLGLACSTDKEHLASGSSDSTICIWKIESKELIKTLKGHSLHVSSVAFTQDGEYLVSGSCDKTLGVWNVLSGERLKSLVSHSDSVWAIAFSKDGQYLVSGSEDHTIVV